MKAASDAWTEARCEARWGPDARAPRWWISLDIAWHLDRGKLPSARSLAAFWGWGHTAAAEAIVEALDEQLVWARDPDERARLEAMRPKPRGGRGHSADIPRTSDGQAADTAATANADNPPDERTSDGQAADAHARVRDPDSDPDSDHEGGTRAGGAPLAGRTAGAQLEVLGEAWTASCAEVWAAWRSHPYGADSPEVCPAAERPLVRQALAAHTAAELALVFRWLAHAVDDGVEVFRQRRDYQVLAVVLKADRIGGRVKAAVAWAKGQPMPARSSTSARRSAAGGPPRSEGWTPYQRGRQTGEAWVGLVEVSGLEAHREGIEADLTSQRDTEWRRGLEDGLGPLLAELRGGARAHA